MASFYQPTASNDEDTCKGWQVYCPTLLPSSARLENSYQYVTLIVACVALGLPFLFSLGRRLKHVLSRDKGKRNRSSKKPPLDTNKRASGPQLQIKALSSIHSFYIFRREECATTPDLFVSDYDLHILPFDLVPNKHLAQKGSKKLTLGFLDFEDLGIDVSPEFIDNIFNAVQAQTSGLVLVTNSLSDEGVTKAVSLMTQFQDREIPVILKCRHDDHILHEVDISSISGIIIANACILPDGHRRDYFRSQTLRDVMARCAKERLERPDFFVGFHDPWDTRPSAAVVRRAYKIADHFGAVLQHGSSSLGIHDAATFKQRPTSLSGFEYLRRSETSELQKSWINRKRVVKVDSDRADKLEQVASLPFGGIQTVLPDIDKLMLSLPMSYDLQHIRLEHPPEIPAPDYTRFAPNRTDFWDSSANGEQVSFYGCVPLVATASPKQYDAVLETQTHLRRLKMLQHLDEAETNKHIKMLKQFLPVSKYQHLIDALIDGLTNQHVSVYKGLGTGFTVPDSSAQFWGLSVALSNSPTPAVDLFISRRSPSDIHVILHTWLAHHGVPRVHRFDEEMRLEHMSEPLLKSGLPLCIRHDIENSTPAELLFVLQQLQVCQVENPYKQAIETFCKAILVDNTSAVSWNDAHSRRYLDGSITIATLLDWRLKEFTKLGATRLPSLENLIQLSLAIERLVRDSLYYGEREPLNILTDALLHAYDPWNSWTNCAYVDINADIFALIFFCALRKAALEDVFIEATDHCPFFLSQPDQAAVFSELWALGSQCELYFGMLPRDLGEIVYDQYRLFLTAHPPPPGDWDGQIMTVYTKPETTSINREMNPEGPARDGFNIHKTSQHVRKLIMKFGALSIFCFPAILDVLLLTFVGRGLFMTAWIGRENLPAACYALLISLLISAGVTGWVGSVGNYYLYNYAYENMIHFHVQRLSGGFVLTVIVGVVGTIIFSIKNSVGTGFVFLAYIVVITTYLNVLGVMATMHHSGSPLTSGRTVLWRTIPVLFLSPIISTLISGHDILVYLPVSYGFLILLLIQYRWLCHEWSSWTHKIPDITEDDIVEWYSSKLSELDASDDTDERQPQAAPELVKKAAVAEFGRRVRAYKKDLFQGSLRSSGRLVSRVASGMPYIEWLLQKNAETAAKAEPFSLPWFAQLNQGVKSQQQMSQGLKEHNIFMLFRYARFDIGQNVGLFLIALMDRWVSITMSAQSQPIDLFINHRAKYGICFALLYFCASVMTLDGTLQKYWQDLFKLSNEKLASYEHAKSVAKTWERRRQLKYLTALLELLRRLMFIFGGSTLFVWILVDDVNILILYYAYVVGYSAVMIFQFNRCFTTDIKYHVGSILFAAPMGYITGCVLHSVPATRSSFYSDVIAMNTAAIIAALLTSVWVWKDWHMTQSGDSAESVKLSTECYRQKKISDMGILNHEDRSPDKPLRGVPITSKTPTFVAQRISDIISISMERPNPTALKTPWSSKLLKTSLSMWNSGKIVLTICTRASLVDSEFADSTSFSTYKDGTLSITAGFLHQSEIGLPSWQPLHAYLLTESLLHHVARAILNLNGANALLAEHCLHETTTMARRIDLELSTESIDGLFGISRKTNLKLMKHLCLDVDVSTAWNDLPAVTREAIICRIVGDPGLMSHELCDWMASADIDTHASDFLLDLCLLIHEKAIERQVLSNDFFGRDKVPVFDDNRELRYNTMSNTPSGNTLLWTTFSFLRSIPTIFTKWVGILSGAGSDVEREIWYSLRHIYGQSFFVRIALSLWRLCWIVKNFWVYVLLIYHRKALVKISRLAKKGATRMLYKNIITVELRRKTVTGFASRNCQDSITLDIFNGQLSQRPTSSEPCSKAVYDCQFRLATREDNEDQQNTTTTTYTYAEGSSRRWPTSKHITRSSESKWCFYDTYGRVTQGTWSINNNIYEFQYSYKSSPKGSHEVLKAEFRLTQNSRQGNDCLIVYWGVPLRPDVGKILDWVPSDRLCRVVKKIGNKTYTTTSNYQHRYDPVMITVLEDGGAKGTLMAQAPTLFDDEDRLKCRPTDVSFINDDLLIHHNRSELRRVQRYSNRSIPLLSVLNPAAWLYWRRKVTHQRVPTWWLRTELWNNWLKSGSLDGVTACWLDEVILREEPLLKKYWGARNMGRLSDAKNELDANIDQIVAATELDKDVSEVCLLPIKSADLYAMGLGKDANQMTTRPQDCFRDTTERISVIFNDIGCWPESPGGVSNCRRDLVNGHSTIRNHVLAESANEYGIPRFQIEKNVQSLKILPLWGLDRKTPNHGVIDNLLQSEVDEKISNTTVRRDIVGTFIPLLKAFVHGARSKRVSRKDLVKYSNVMLTMFEYFQHKDYNETWNSKEVASAWIAAWLTPYNDPNIVEFAKSFALERPTMSDFRDALNIYISYFFIFSVQAPGDCPKVFQSTHHGISSLFGMLLKYRRGATFGIWDHAILWRECCLNISPAQCQLPIPVQSMLLAGIGLATRLAYFHADVVLPCTPFFNPIWEAEIGTDRGRLGSKKQFTRKIDPIVNGVSDMDSFKPVELVRSETPTVVMLSNVQFIKDIKTAILSADIIINKFGFKDYRLMIYGSKDREPSYAIEMGKLIAQHNLSDRVILAGFGNPQEALKDAWLFMNSSLSEGLPLAIAEAALAGVPIVATAVGATSLVLTDPDDPEQMLGEVVPPNDPRALARAQISMLAMVGPWAKFTGEVGKRQSVPPSLTVPEALGEREVQWLTRRMYEKVDDRRKLGMLSRQTVLRGFHGKRYLREHEQMYWIQWHLARMRKDPELTMSPSSLLCFGAQVPLRYAEDYSEQSIHEVSPNNLEKEGQSQTVQHSNDIRWQDFSSDEYAGRKLSKQRVEERSISLMSTV